MNISKRRKTTKSDKTRGNQKKVADGEKNSDSMADLKLALEIGESVEIFDIDLDKWQKCHSDLDLQIPIWIKSEELLQVNLTKTIQFSRLIKLTPDAGPVKERDSFTFIIPAAVHDGLQIVVKEKGDKKGEFCGDLIIILRVKH